MMKPRPGRHILWSDAEDVAPDGAWNSFRLVSTKRSRRWSAGLRPAAAPHSSLPLHRRRDFETKRIQTNETGRVVLVVGLRRIGFHRGDARMVEAHGGFAARDHDVAFVKFHAHRAGHVFLA